MDSPKKRNGRYGPAFLALLLVGWLLSAPNSATFAQALPAESFFASVSKPVGIAASLGRLLVTPFWCNGITGFPAAPQVLSIGRTGTPSVFATLPAQGSSGDCFEYYIAITPANPSFQSVASTTQPGVYFPTPFFNNFTSNDVYVTEGPNIIKISFDGSTVSLFATISSCAAASATSGNGITFDQVGTFGNNMIVACANGLVFLVNGSGQTVDVNGKRTAKPIAGVSVTAGQVVEGPDVAPLTFGSFGGQLLVTVSPPGDVVAINPKNGKVSEVAPVPTAESVASIPTTKCTFGLSSAAYFTAFFAGNEVDFLPLGGVFTGLGDGQHALVTTEGSVSGAGVTLLTSTGGTSPFVSFGGENQGQAFVNCATPLLLSISRTEASFSIGPGALGVLDIFINQTPNFNPLNICVGTTTADGSQPCALPVPQANVTGAATIPSSFKECGKSLVSMGSGPALDCKFFKNLLSAQSINKFTGAIIVKLFYLGPTGDGEACGG